MKFSFSLMGLVFLGLSVNGASAGTPEQDVKVLCTAARIGNKIPADCHKNGEAAYANGKVALFRAVCLKVKKCAGGVSALERCTNALNAMSGPVDAGFGAALKVCSSMETKMAEWGYEEDTADWAAGKLSPYLCMDSIL